MPETTGLWGRTALYRLFSSDGSLLYVGISNDPEKRFISHRSKSTWWDQVDGISIEWFSTRFKACQAERAAITTEQPRHNLSGTDAYRAEQRATALAVSPDKRRNRSIGLKARAVQVRTFKRLIAEGVPENEAKHLAREAREEFKEAHLRP
ncbi:GIY-YIG nuclease family protein [Streptomyces sp. P9-1]|jgi:predicted GIY-YIG superfamily endonuclease|uniref:GIY-YIG nuclease family protein n=1 Tax=Streptomyces sp. P9-1 TaxID=3422589 RepID=UPI003D3641A7